MKISVKSTKNVKNPRKNQNLQKHVENWWKFDKNMKKIAKVNENAEGKLTQIGKKRKNW